MQKLFCRQRSRLPAYIHYIRLPLQEGNNTINVQYKGTQKSIQIDGKKGIQLKCLSLQSDFFPSVIEKMKFSQAITSVCYNFYFLFEYSFLFKINNFQRVFDRKNWCQFFKKNHIKINSGSLSILIKMFSCLFILIKSRFIINKLKTIVFIY